MTDPLVEALRAELTGEGDDIAVRRFLRALVSDAVLPLLVAKATKSFVENANLNYVTRLRFAIRAALRAPDA